MEPIRQWLETQLGLAPGFLDALVLPLLAVLVLWLVRELALLIAGRFIADPRRRQFWRRASFYLMVLLGVGAFGGIWLASLRRIAAVIGAETEPERQEVVPWLLSAVYALIATAVLLVVLRITWVAYHFAVRKIEDWASGAAGLRYQKAVLMTSGRIREMAAAGLRVVRGVLVLVLLSFYLPLILSLFPFTRDWGSGLLTWILQSASTIGLAIVGYLPNLVSLILILLVVRYIMRIVRFLMKAVEKGDVVLPGFDPDWADPTYSLLRVVAALLTMVFCYPLLPGAGSEVFKGFSIFVGALVTIGSTSVIGNVISGVVLTYTRSFHVGDRVQIGETVGDVLEKTLFVTRLRTIKNEEVTVPNGVVLAGRILNFSAVAETHGLILHTTIGIGYDVDWRQVHQLLEAAAGKTENLLADPPPFVWQTTLGDYAVNYELNVYTKETKKIGAIYSELRKNILDGFNEAGIEIMTPTVGAVRDANQPAIPPGYNPKPFDFPGLRFLFPKRHGSD
ncbi:MAG: mechanosensitive ion channel [bacterium]|nr:mechanosensitive ion channel [bacterium]